MNSTTTPTTSSLGLTGSEELIAVFSGVVAFFVIGVLMFLACFIITKLYQWHKMRLARKKRQEMGDDSPPMPRASKRQSNRPH